MDCIFCKIVDKKIPATIVFENDHVLAFRDLHPACPTHILVIPKKHIRGIHEASPEDAQVLGQLLLAGRHVAEEQKLSSGYRLVINNGPDAGQSVLHLHVHVLGGRAMAWPPG